MKVGYARVSTKDQNLSLQIGALKKVSYAKVYQDTQSGKSKNRSALNLALEILRKGDSLIGWTIGQVVEEH